MTDLTPPSAGLRNIANRTKSPIRTEVVVPMGDELEVSDALAGQLVAAGLVDETPDTAEASEKPTKKAAAKRQRG